MDNRQQLEQVNEAIAAILSGGQSYKIGNRSLTRADLTTLYKMKKELENNTESDNGGGLGRCVAVGYFEKR